MDSNNLFLKSKRFLFHYHSTRFKPFIPKIVPFFHFTKMFFKIGVHFFFLHLKLVRFLNNFQAKSARVLANYCIRNCLSFRFGFIVSPIFMEKIYSDKNGLKMRGFYSINDYLVLRFKSKNKNSLSY